MPKIKVESRKIQTLDVDTDDLAYSLVDGFDEIDIRSFFDNFLEQLSRQGKEYALFPYFKYETNVERMKALMEGKIW